mgnify:CR=1 FL=1
MELFSDWVRVFFVRLSECDAVEDDVLIRLDPAAGVNDVTGKSLKAVSFSETVPFVVARGIWIKGNGIPRLLSFHVSNPLESKSTKRYAQEQARLH